MKKKLTDYLEKAVTAEAVVRRIAFYLLIICVFLCLIFFKLNEINQTILEVNEPILSSVKTEENESVKDVFIEENDNIIGDVLPMYNELKESESKKEDEAVSDKATVNTTEASTGKSFEDESTAQQQSSSKKSDFVINVSSKKIHYADCTFVGRMKEENRKAVQLSYEELNEYINNGYKLCSTCGG